jgi:hypothetical protein
LSKAIRTRVPRIREGHRGFAPDRYTNTIAAVRRSLALVALVLAMPATACREADAKYPAECSNGTRALRTALANAPDGDVSLEGVKLSDCLVPADDAGPLASFGGAVISVAAPLVERARRGDQQAVLELGYLHGALERGADPGIHDELLFRFDQELIRIDRRSPAFRRGEAAGRDHG